MKKALLIIAAAGVAALGVATGPADARIKAGVLKCQVSPSVGYIIGSQKTIDCRFESVKGYREHYVGRLTNIGLDVGFTNGGKLAWAVYAAAKPKHGALAGGYAGASAEATLAAGLGANVLIGGFNNSIGLQPLSVSAQTGLNLALGVSGLELTAAR